MPGSSAVSDEPPPCEKRVRAGSQPGNLGQRAGRGGAPHEGRESPSRRPALAPAAVGFATAE